MSSTHFDIQAATSSRAVYPQPGQKPPGPGQMPPKVANLQYTPMHQFYHPNGKPHDTLRDLGFTGILDGRVVWTWGDTLMGRADGPQMICATDSTSIGSLENPMGSMDTALFPHSNNVCEWIPCTAEEEQQGGLSEHAYGGTNIIEYEPGKGYVFFLHNHRPGGNGKIMGAGVATCQMGPNHIPQAQRGPSPRMWNDFEPYWGDVGIAYDSRDGYLYAYGHGPEDFGSRTFLCRVPIREAQDVSKYEYWKNHSREWTRQRMTLSGALGTLKIDKETEDKNEGFAIFGWYCMNQSPPFWSNYFNKWMLLHTDGWPFTNIKCKTADKLEGPWEDHGDVAETKPQGHPSREGFRYCAVGHPEFDQSGKRVLVTWTNDNQIWGVWIEFQ